VVTHIGVELDSLPKQKVVLDVANLVMPGIDKI
jgi:hypothetical protein